MNLAVTFSTKFLSPSYAIALLLCLAKGLAFRKILKASGLNGSRVAVNWP